MSYQWWAIQWCEHWPEGTGTDREGRMEVWFARGSIVEENLQERGNKVIIEMGLRHTRSERLLIMIVSLKKNETAAMAGICLQNLGRKQATERLLHPSAQETRLHCFFLFKCYCFPVFCVNSSLT